MDLLRNGTADTLDFIDEEVITTGGKIKINKMAALIYYKEFTGHVQQHTVYGIF